MKKTLLFVSMALVGLSVYGCGSGSTETTETPEKKDETAATPPPATDGPGIEPSKPVSGFAAVQEILTKNCVSCHTGAKAQEGVKLTSYDEVMAGGEHGPIVKAGDVEGSLIYKAITGAAGVKKMPPAKTLSTDEVAAIADWIKSGAAKS